MRAYANPSSFGHMPTRLDFQHLVLETLCRDGILWWICFDQVLKRSRRFGCSALRAGGFRTQTVQKGAVAGTSNATIERSQSGLNFQ